jgi:acetyl-CoA acetyltransferase
VLTTAERGRDAAKRAIRVLGAGESHTHRLIAQMPDLTRTAGAASAREAFTMAGIGPQDVDVLEPYDSFTITVLLALEDLGLCPRGESGAFVEGGRLAPGGDLPAMTSGGGLSYCHPGRLGLLLLVEAVRQLRGEAGERQVPGEPEIAVAHGVGGYLSSAATVVLAR